MIILSGVLVVVAIALLVAGIVAGNGDSAQVFGLDALVVIYISIAVSIVSALCLAIGVFLRRKELWGPGVSAAPARPAKRSRKDKKDRKDKRRKAAPPVPAASAAGVPGAPAPSAASAADPADDVLEMPAPPADVPEDALVFVVRGRKRYHLDTCRQLAGRDAEELTYAEAKEEGFSPCTACMPDTALAARAAASVPASGPGGAPGGEAGGTAGAAAREPAPRRSEHGLERSEHGPERSERGLAGLAKPVPPPAPQRPANPAGPTLTDIPVTGSAGTAAGEKPETPKTSEKPEKSEETGSAAREPETRPVWDGPVEAGSAAPDVTVDLGPSPHTGADAAAPKPRHASEAADEGPGAAGGDAGAETAGSDALGPEPATGAGSEPSGAEPSDAESSGADAAGAAEGPQVRILSGTKRYHRVDCALIEDIGDEADDLESLSRAEAKSRGCTPCLVCQPDREHARD